MIPTVNESGVLPPFLPTCSPAMRAAVAPYSVSLAEFVQRYAITNIRKQIITGYLSYRKQLKSIGITSGFQWIDGSFTEDVELLRKRGPSDIDLITFAFRPASCKDDEDWNNLVKANINLFDPGQSKSQYYCDAYFVYLDTHPLFLVKNISYWYGLFSHQKETFLWKGMLEIDLDDSEDGFEDFLILEEEAHE